MITPEFVELYMAEKEKILAAHIPYGTNNLTIRKASQYLKQLSDFLFGNEFHGGVIQYIQSQPSGPQTPEEILRLAEKYYDRGWHIKNVEGRFWLFTEAFKRVADLTGATASVQHVPLILDVENTSKFLTVQDGEQLIKVATKNGIERSNLKSPKFTLEMVNKYEYANQNLLAVAKNYSSMGSILDKFYAYNLVDDSSTVTAEELLELGYRIEPVLHPSDAVIAHLTNGTEHIKVVKVTNSEDGTDKGACVWAHNSLIQMFPEFVVDESVTELAEMGQVYALVFKSSPFGFDSMDYGDIEVLVRNIFDDSYMGMMPQNYVDQLRERIATYIVARILFFKDEGFSLASFSVNPASASIYQRWSNQYNLKDLTVDFSELNFRMQNAGAGNAFEDAFSKNSPAATGFAKPNLATYRILAPMLKLADIDSLEEKLDELDIPKFINGYEEYLNTVRSILGMVKTQ